MIIDPFLKQLPNNIEIYKNKSLSDFTFNQTGGKAEYLAFPKSSKEFGELIKIANNKKILIHVFGQLTNLLISDFGIKGLIIITEKMNHISRNNNYIVADTGIAMLSVSEFALENHLSGLEWAAGLPGSVGGAVYMNAGAYGGNTSETLQEIIAFNNSGNKIYLKKKDLSFSYRNSTIKKNNYYIVQAKFKLKREGYKKIRSLMDNFNLRRICKQPLNLPSNGSVFKRPPGLYAGKLISNAGLQGICIGGAQLSTKHANFIVNINKAKSDDYLKIISLVKNTIKNDFGINMHLEIEIIGEGIKRYSNELIN